MTFFSRPDLSSVQFKQLPDSILTLSGQTQIATISGLTLYDGSGGNVVITAKGADITKDKYVLTYDYPNNQILLCLSAASGGTTVYDYTGLTTCSVGGVSVGSCLLNCQLQEIIHTMVSPALNPTLTLPYVQSFSLSCLPTTSTGFYEIGTCICVTGNATFSQGCIAPQYCSGPDKRSGPPNTYCYWSNVVGPVLVPSAYCTNSHSFASHQIACDETYCVKVCYASGNSALNSCGGVYATALLASATTICSAGISATYPYFWGKSTTLPIAGSGLTNTACGLGKVCISTSAIDTCVSNYKACGEYIWLAIPATSTTKTKWQMCNSPSNCGTIPGTLFAAEQCVVISSCCGCWSLVPYKFYISNYPTSASGSSTINYITVFKNS